VGRGRIACDMRQWRIAELGSERTASDRRQWRGAKLGLGRIACDICKYWSSIQKTQCVWCAL
jgi:hypothetical protein